MNLFFFFKLNSIYFRYLAATQFEAINAREAFPCYDEPGLKAIFQTNIYVPSGYHAICNTEQTNVTSL